MLLVLRIVWIWLCILSLCRIVEMCVFIVVLVMFRL